VVFGVNDTADKKYFFELTQKNLMNVVDLVLYNLPMYGYFIDIPFKGNSSLVNVGSPCVSDVNIDAQLEKIIEKKSFGQRCH
jgi:NADPH-dependent 7-cyano-7-deazaguanine reductase QueF-like protein